MTRPLAIVVALADNGVIGRDNRLIWRLKTDLRRFRDLTVGRPMITPLVENGNGPLNGVWKFVMSSCMSMTALLVSLRAASMPAAWAW